MKYSKVQKICAHCAAEFKVIQARANSAKFCSRLCADASQRASFSKATCKTCGIEFSAPADHGANRVYCSKECFCKKNPNPILEANCQVCGEKFRSKWDVRTGAYRKYCSKACGDKGRQNKVLKTCHVCGSPTYKSQQKLSSNMLFFCSNACSAQHYSGSNAWNWSGGRYKEEATGRIFVASLNGYASEHRVIVANILGRDLRYLDEPIYHLNGDLSDNRIENLYIFPSFEAMGEILQNGPIPKTTNIVPLDYSGH